MNELHLLPQDERELFFRTVINTKKMPFEVIEKDYWVVWVLKRLFSLEKMKPYLTFKGGTSLSKVYGLIDRFSEDIDLSIEREFFGKKRPSFINMFIYLQIKEFLHAFPDTSTIFFDCSILQ